MGQLQWSYESNEYLKSEVQSSPSLANLSKSVTDLRENTSERISMLKGVTQDLIGLVRSDQSLIGQVPLIDYSLGIQFGFYL